MRYLILITCLLFFSAAELITGAGAIAVETPPAIKPAHPTSPAKLVFIYPSSCEKWVNGLGGALGSNNYILTRFNDASVPGGKTDVGLLWDIFAGSEKEIRLETVYNRTDPPEILHDPGGENEIILFMSDFKNSILLGNPDDPPTTGENPLAGKPASSEHMTVSNVKGLFMEMLKTFEREEDKLFIFITAPPVSPDNPDYNGGESARGLNNWLINQWLKDYPHRNVSVFDYFNVLTSNGGDVNTNDLGQGSGNHHRWHEGAIEHIRTVSNNSCAYCPEEAPTPAGDLKATGEFIPILNFSYRRFKGAEGAPPFVATGSIESATSTSAIFKGSVDPVGEAKYYFEYGLMATYGLETKPGYITDDKRADVTAPVTGLFPDSVYHYRLVAENDNGRVYGANRTFATKSLSGVKITDNLTIRAEIETVEKGIIEAVWEPGGSGSTPGGDSVYWGYFYASPIDVGWGSRQNPDVFVKIWFDRSGRLDVNFFHVSVPDIHVFSGYMGEEGPRETGVLSLSSERQGFTARYIRHYYADGSGGSEKIYTKVEDDGAPPLGDNPMGNPWGSETDGPMKIGAMIKSVEKGLIEAVWSMGGGDETAGGHRVVWGHFYASPKDVAWGDQNNPDLFVKIWFDISGRIDVNFFHVSVPDIEVFSQYPSGAGEYGNSGTTKMDNRYVRHEYFRESP